MTYLHSSTDIGLDVPRGKVPSSPVMESRKQKRERRTWAPNLRTLCIALHIGLVLIHAIPVCLVASAAIRHSPRGLFTTTIPTPFHYGDDHNWISFVTFLILPGINVAIQLVGISYTTILVWLTQQLTLRRTLHDTQTLTAMHDRSNAWLGLGSAVLALLDQFRLKSSPKDVSAISVYLFAIFGIHVTTPNLVSISGTVLTISIHDPSPQFISWPYFIQLNPVPAIAGLIISIILLISSSILIRPKSSLRSPEDKPEAELHASLDSTGILQYTWLLAHEPHYSTILPPMLRAKKPTRRNLRRAGMTVNVTMNDIYRGEKAGSEDELSV